MPHLVFEKFTPFIQRCSTAFPSIGGMVTNFKKVTKLGRPNPHIPKFRYANQADSKADKLCRIFPFNKKHHNGYRRKGKRNFCKGRQSASRIFYGYCLD